ncbi:unnamed protein product, partial [Onchocerca flexuosa]|uniref:Ovule protein n=1 Tax=Onchocerca flexuosa TaxID=387005 RepID=A0A183I8G0_9BILA
MRRKSAPEFYSMPTTTTANIIMPLYQPFYSSRDENSVLYNGNEIKPPVLLKKGECQCPIPPPSPDAIHLEEIEKEEYMILFCVIRPSQIDKYARSIFPL